MAQESKRESPVCLISSHFLECVRPSPHGYLSSPCCCCIQVPWGDEAGTLKPGGGKSGGGAGESSMKLEWPTSVLTQYSPGKLQDSPKMAVLQELVFRSVKVGEKVLIFR